MLSPHAREPDTRAPRRNTRRIETQRPAPEPQFEARSSVQGEHGSHPPDDGEPGTRDLRDRPRGRPVVTVEHMPRPRPISSASCPGPNRVAREDADLGQRACTSAGSCAGRQSRESRTAARNRRLRQPPEARCARCRSPRSVEPDPDKEHRSAARGFPLRYDLVNRDGLGRLSRHERPVSSSWRAGR